MCLLLADHCIFAGHTSVPWYYVCCLSFPIRVSSMRTGTFCLCYLSLYLKCSEPGTQEVLNKYLLNELLNPDFKSYTSHLESEDQQILVTCSDGKFFFLLGKKEGRKGKRKGTLIYS